MAITNAMCNSYKSEVLDGVHEAGDEYKIALIKSGHAGTFNKTTDNYSDLGADEVANGSGYTTGGKVLASRVVSLDGDVAITDWADPVWAAATISADGALIYNNSQSGKAVAVFAFPTQPTVSTNGSFTAVLPAAAAATALVRIA